MSIYDEVKKLRRNWIKSNDKTALTFNEIKELTGEKDSAVYRFLHGHLNDGSWELAGYKRNDRGQPIKAYRETKKSKK
jgi:hypothetical protein